MLQICSVWGDRCHRYIVFMERISQIYSVYGENVRDI